VNLNSSITEVSKSCVEAAQLHIVHRSAMWYGYNWCVDKFLHG